MSERPGRRCPSTRTSTRTAPRSSLWRALQGRFADDDRGAVSAFAVGMIVVLFAVAGLVADGGRAVNARVAIVDDAEQAARSGADQLDVTGSRETGVLGLDPVAARQAAVDFLAARGYDVDRVSVTTTGDEVSVAVSTDIPTTLLQLAFVNSFTVEGTATARAAVGIVTEIPGAP